MSRIPASIGVHRRSATRSAGLLTSAATRRLAARAARPGTPGLIAPGPGFVLPRLEEPLWQFSAIRNDGALFAANLLRSGFADAADWEGTRKVGPFLQRSLKRFVGDRADEIDCAFDISVSLGPNPSTWRAQDDIDPRKILLTFRVASTVGWVNLAPALDLLKAEHRLLPTLFYHWLDDSLCHWFRVFNVSEAKWSWESWMDRRTEDEEERKRECEREGVPFEPIEGAKEPCLPECIGEMPRKKVANVRSLTTSATAIALVEAAQQLNHTASGAECPSFSSDDREEMVPDSDPPIPLIALAFGQHDVVTEMLNMELEIAGQVEAEPWPIIQMDGTDPASIQRAFHIANVVLDTLVAASRTLLLVPGFEPSNKNSFGA